MTIEGLEEGFDIGLSEEEKEDLESLISTWKKGTVDTHGPETLNDEMTDMRKKMAELASTLLLFDKRIGLLFEIVKLTHEKSEVLNRRLCELETDGGGRVKRSAR